jgi:iron complex outermembrane recepter protein
LDGAWNFLAGLYREKVEDDYMLEARWHGTPASNPFGAALMGGTTQQRELTQKAAFGEISWKFMPAFTLTGGVRAYDFDRAQLRGTSGPIFGGTTSSFLRTDASGTSFRGNLSYRLSDNALFYAGWSQGFRLGKPQPGLPSGLCDPDGDGIVDGTNVSVASTTSIDSDEVDNYELGGKFALFDRRMVIAVDFFRVDWSGVPVRVVAPIQPIGCGRAYTANAGDARSEGVELQASMYVTDAFRIDVGGSAIRAELTKDAPGLIPPAFEGDRLPGSPEVNANLGLQYMLDIGGHKAYLRADSIYIGRFYGDLQGSAISASGDYLKIDASARVEFGNLNFDLYVRNLTDTDEFTFRDTAPLVPAFGYRMRPRTIGVQLGYTF